MRGVNYGLLKYSAYTKNQVLLAIDEIELFARDVVTYASLSFYVFERIKMLQQKFGSELIIISKYLEILNKELPISDFDRQLILIHLEKQRKIVELIK